jgi:DNA-binding SARP family transcriptional activator
MLKVCLFGTFTIEKDGEMLASLDARKVQEVFCYLLIYRYRPQPRETLAGTLWGDHTTPQSRKALRQALWQIQSGLGMSGEGATSDTPGHIFIIQPDIIYFNPHADLWLDVACLEAAFANSSSVAAEQMEDKLANELREVVELYRGDLLEGWYQDWCLYEREHLQNMYLAILDRLMVYCEARAKYEEGLTYGDQALQYNRACERTHQRLMRLHYLVGNRAAALRQYHRCCVALQEEMGVRPARRTTALHEQIKADHLEELPAAFAASPAIVPAPPLPTATLIPAKGAVDDREGRSIVADAVNRLKSIQSTLTDLQHQIQYELKVLESLDRP